MSALKGVVIVGAGPAGLRTAEHLRRRGYDGTVTLIGEEPCLPYDRPALSKQFLMGDVEAESLSLRDGVELEALRLDLRLGHRAVSLDLGARRVLLDHDIEVAYGALVIATGSRPRRLASGQELAGVHYLRSLADATRLREDLRATSRLVIVGGGFVGCEVAAAARQLGVSVCLLEGGQAPLANIVGAQLGRVVQARHEEHGVQVICDAQVSGLEGAERVTGVRLADGRVLEADTVLVGIGAVPATDWLDSSGLSIRDGVLCDSFCSAGAGVFAAGDVARWQHPSSEDHMRVEHWTNAAEQSAVVADSVLAHLGGEPRDRARRPYSPVPYFWSDQFDMRIQFAGTLRAGDDVSHVPGEDGRHVVTYGRSGRLVGALTINAPRELLRLRAAIGRGQPWSPAGEPLASAEQVVAHG